jgi:hypothetical protein
MAMAKLPAEFHQGAPIMRISTRNLAFAASAVLVLAAGGAALAQVPASAARPSGPPAPPPPPMDMMMAGGPHIMMMRGHGDPAAHAQHLRDVLQLRADQEGA